VGYPQEAEDGTPMMTRGMGPHGCTWCQRPCAAYGGSLEVGTV
jgi:hypothetical protein